MISAPGPITASIAEGRPEATGAHRLPALAVLLGVAGLIPFLACGYLALTPVGIPDLMALLAYGAAILAFLGGVHWGFALIDPARRAVPARLALGVMPSLAGWVALLLAIADLRLVGLALLAIGFAATTIVEARAAHRGLMPRGYLGLRYGLSATVIVVLLAVLVLRLAGVTVPSVW